MTQFAENVLYTICKKKKFNFQNKKNIGAERTDKI